MKLNADDPKNSHLRELEGAKERLILCKADLLDFESLKAAITGCHGVFHTASPVTDDPVKFSLFSLQIGYQTLLFLHEEIQRNFILKLISAIRYLNHVSWGKVLDIVGLTRCFFGGLGVGEEREALGLGKSMN